MPLMAKATSFYKGKFCEQIIVDFFREMQDRGISFTGRMSEITFAINLARLAKERCSPTTAYIEINILATVI
jgi:hypothetical protein